MSVQEVMLDGKPKDYVSREDSGRATDWTWINGFGRVAVGSVRLPWTFNRPGFIEDLDRYGRVIGREPYKPLVTIVYE